MGALTCQNDYAFPYEPVAANLLKLDPDLLYFSGDQLYENHGGYGIIRDPAEPAILNYLRKFYQFGWAFREAMRDRPTLCIPDDHDVFQGNIWGEGGQEDAVTARPPARAATASRPGWSTWCIKRTPRTIPTTTTRTPVLQDISVYYGDMVYGGVGFAIIADRQLKSGPEMVDTGGGRADHVSDPNFDTAKLDKTGPGAAGRAAGGVSQGVGRRLAGAHAQGAAQPNRLRRRGDASRRLQRLPQGRPRLRRLAANAAQSGDRHHAQGDAAAHQRRPAPDDARAIRRRQAARQQLVVLHAGHRGRLSALVAAG